MSTTYTYDLCVYIGRFQPFHNGHFHVVQEAAKRAPLTLVICGRPDYRVITPNHPKYDLDVHLKNPFKWWTATSVKECVKRTISVKTLTDKPQSDTEWVIAVKRKVKDHAKAWCSVSKPKIALIGHNKDASSNYLTWFPEWDSIDVKPIIPVNATDIRNIIFGTAGGWPEIEAMMPPPAVKWLRVCVMDMKNYPQGIPAPINPNL